MFIALYIIPFIIVLLGSIPWVRRDSGLGVPMFLLALFPGVNLLAAGAIMVIRLWQAINRKQP